MIDFGYIDFSPAFLPHMVESIMYERNSLRNRVDYCLFRTVKKRVVPKTHHWLLIRLLRVETILLSDDDPDGEDDALR